ncbi:glycoside hydrolase, partial [Ceratobasidium sp. AG-I]
YNLDSVSWSSPKINAVVNLVKTQVGAGTPIDGIGTECHISASGVSAIQAALTQLTTAGVEVAITELDIQGGTSLDRQSVIQACLAVPRCIGISQWGVERGGWTLLPATTSGIL